MIEVGAKVMTREGAGTVLASVDTPKWKGYVVEHRGTPARALYNSAEVARAFVIGNIVSVFGEDGLGLVVSEHGWNVGLLRLRTNLVKPGEDILAMSLLTLVHKGAAQ